MIEGCEHSKEAETSRTISALLPSLSEIATFQNCNQSARSSSEENFFRNGFSFGDADNIYGSADNIAWDAGKEYQGVRKNALQTDIVRQISAPNIAAQAERAVFPLRGREDERLGQVSATDADAWQHALDAMPELKRTGVTDDVLKAIVRNELHFYDVKDARDDREAHFGHDPGRTATLGFAQVSAKGIAEFEATIPAFKRFLESKGYTGPAHEVKALEDPTCAPMIVAAKLTSLVASYEKHNRMQPDCTVQINALSLIYGYNADVQARNQNGKVTYASMPDRLATIERFFHPDLHKVYPTSDPDVLRASHHVANVLEQLQIIRSERNSEQK